jgi:threonine dehydrogenase-like Zn-dependent dehydrogenase
MAPFVIDEITVVGSRCGPFDTAIRMLETGAVSVEPLISARYPLEDAVIAFERAVQKNVLKVLLQVS